MYTEVITSIAAPPDTVWSVLTDPDALVSGDFGITRLEGVLRPGARIKLWTEISPKRAFPLKVTELSAPHRMVWTGSMPLGLFKGVRVFDLASDGDGTQFHMHETFSGLLARMIDGSMPDLYPSFEKFANALKTRAEAV